MSSAMDITTMLNGEQRPQHPQISPVDNMLPSSVRNITGYPSPTEPTQPLHMLQDSYEHPPPFDDTRVAHATNADGHRTFPCTSCGKGFARRSDLARHERIHSNIRPHICPEPNCNKQFIQRSALTVHMRVHTGEKPHLCERCGKPFSDSSSLARHRRIHSGRRPYQCPYADCLKTFTRRTTLTRHQNHHTGTIEEAAAATARALATRGPEHRRRSSAGTDYSDSASGLSSVGTPSPSGHTFPISPLTDIPQIPPLDRSTSIPLYENPLPPHLRPGLQQPSPRSSPTASSPSPSLFGAQRPSLTSHPGTLPVLEPPAYHELRSGSGSPHLSTPGAGWQSPIPHGIPSPMGSEYQYHEQSAPPNMPLYLANSNMRRLSSTEPDHFDLNRPRLGSTSGGTVWGGGT